MDDVTEEIDECIEDLETIKDRMLGRKYKDACDIAIKHLSCLRGALDDTPKDGPSIEE